GWVRDETCVSSEDGVCVCVCVCVCHLCASRGWVCVWVCVGVCVGVCGLGVWRHACRLWMVCVCVCVCVCVTSVHPVGVGVCGCVWVCVGVCVGVWVFSLCGSHIFLLFF